MLDEAVSALIADIYTGAHERTAWDRTMSTIGSRLGAQFLMVATVDAVQQRPVESGFYNVRCAKFDDAIAEYNEGLCRTDPSIRHAARHPDGGRFDSIAGIGADAYRADDFVRWNIATWGSMFWTTLHSGSAGHPTFGISLHRSPADGPSPPEDIALLELLFGHMRNALRLAARPVAPEVGEPILILDGRGAVMAASRPARAILDARDGLILSDKCLRATASGSAVRFDAAIRSALSGIGAGGSVALERNAGPPLLASVRPLPAAARLFSGLHLGAIVRLVEPRIEACRGPDDWAALFGFTAAETRLAGALLTGDGNLRETAERLGIAHATARVQLAGVFDKADVRSQSQLVKLLARLG